MTEQEELLGVLFADNVTAELNKRARPQDLSDVKVKVIADLYEASSISEFDVLKAQQDFIDSAEAVLNASDRKKFFSLPRDSEYSRNSSLGSYRLSERVPFHKRHNKTPITISLSEIVELSSDKESLMTKRYNLTLHSVGEGEREPLPNFGVIFSQSVNATEGINDHRVQRYREVKRAQSFVEYIAANQSQLQERLPSQVAL